MNTRFLFAILIAAFMTSCTVTKPLYSDVEDQKAYITQKYGTPNDIVYQNGNEFWLYNQSHLVKNSRTVVFDSDDRIISNEKGLSTASVVGRTVLGGALLYVVVLGGAVLLLLTA